MKPDDHHFGGIFDLDGVIADTGPAHQQAWEELAARHHLAMPDGFFAETFGMRNENIIPQLLDRSVDPEELQRMSDWKEARYREIIAAEIQPLDGLGGLLRDLQQNGFHLAIGSSAPRANVDLILDGLQIRNRFTACVTGDEISSGKPAPDTFLTAAERLDVSPDHCVVFEDAVPGVQAGKRAGMQVIAITTTRTHADLLQAGADRVIDSLAEVNAADILNILAI